MDSPTDITKLKVIDLKKMLKERGLPITGSKAELIARLQDNEQETNDAIDASGDHIEDELLGGDDDELVEDEEADVQPVTTTLETPTVKEVAEPVDGKTKPERIKITAPGEAAKKPNQLTEEEKVAQRAKRFGGFTSEEAQKLARSQRFGVPVTAKASAPTAKAATKPAGKIEKTAVTPEDIEKIKKRAERFGTVTSTTLSQNEKIDKLKKRADRFGEITSKTVSKADETERQLKRKQRFGAISGPGTVSSSSEVEEKKKKRAERFGITA